MMINQQTLGCQNLRQTHVTGITASFSYLKDVNKKIARSAEAKFQKTKLFWLLEWRM